MDAVPAESRESAERLLNDYVAVVNRVLADRRENFPYAQAIRATRVLWGGTAFRTLVYGRDPQDLLGVFYLRLEPDADVVTVLPPGDHAYAFTWKASMQYLWDVAANRPQRYLEHPLMLDLSWLTGRLRDETARHARERPALMGGAVGFVLGALVATLALRSGGTSSKIAHRR